MPLDRGVHCVIDMDRVRAILMTAAMGVWAGGCNAAPVEDGVTELELSGGRGVSRVSFPVTLDQVTQRTVRYRFHMAEGDELQTNYDLPDDEAAQLLMQPREYKSVADLENQTPQWYTSRITALYGDISNSFAASDQPMLFWAFWPPDDRPQLWNGLGYGNVVGAGDHVLTLTLSADLDPAEFPQLAFQTTITIHHSR